MFYNTTYRLLQHAVLLNYYRPRQHIKSATGWANRGKVGQTATAAEGRGYRLGRRREGRPHRKNPDIGESDDIAFGPKSGFTGWADGGQVHRPESYIAFGPMSGFYRFLQDFGVIKKIQQNNEVISHKCFQTQFLLCGSFIFLQKDV